MNSTYTPLDFPKGIALRFLNTMEEATKDAYRQIWNMAQEVISNHFWTIVMILGVIFLLALLNFIITRRWGWLGSVIYNYLYFGLLYIYTLIFGPDIFANDWIKVILFLVYIICYTITGILLRRIRRSL